MDGVIYLDESYDSGVPGYPGSRFVMDFKQAPADSHRERLARDDIVESSAHSTKVEDLVSPAFQLPAKKSYCLLAMIPYSENSLIGPSKEFVLAGVFEKLRTGRLHYVSSRRII
jgi:hypothetical protein